MEVLIFTIPVITCIILFTKFFKETVWWEYGVVIAPSIIMYFFLKYAMISYSTAATEYLGGYVTSTIYYEEWDEMVLVHKTRQVPDGVDKDGHTKYRTEHYTEWERRYHPEEWAYTDNRSNWEHSISKSMFNYINEKLQAKPVFKDMHRHYHRIDGDAYIRHYNSKPENCYSLTWEHTYENRVKGSDHSIFKFRDLSKKEIKQYGLYEYPEIINLDQNPIIGKKVPYKHENAIRYINAYYGGKKQIRVFILLFDSPNVLVGEMQQSHWLGGNKNEFVVCLGVDKHNNVMWCYPFSWEDKPKLGVETKQYFIDHPKLNIGEYSKFLTSHIHDWKRKEFTDFEYISVELTSTQLTWIIILIIMYNIGISFWVINNEFKN